ncbi:hypothetical protein KQI52_13115 [bacterium]|nr:hypothetical protein [bacterium]
MSRITGKMLIYGAILIVITVGMLVVSQRTGTITGIWALTGWGGLYALVTYLFLRTEEAAKSRGNLRFTYGLIAAIAVFPLVIGADIVLSPASENPVLEKIWLIPAIIVMLVGNYLLQRRTIKGYRKNEVFK